MLHPPIPAQGCRTEARLSGCCCASACQLSHQRSARRQHRQAAGGQCRPRISWSASPDLAESDCCRRVWACRMAAARPPARCSRAWASATSSGRSATCGAPRPSGGAVSTVLPLCLHSRSLCAKAAVPWSATCCDWPADCRHPLTASPGGCQGVPRLLPAGGCLGHQVERPGASPRPDCCTSACACAACAPTRPGRQASGLNPAAPARSLPALYSCCLLPLPWPLLHRRVWRRWVPRSCSLQRLQQLSCVDGCKNTTGWQVSGREPFSADWYVVSSSAPDFGDSAGLGSPLGIFQPAYNGSFAEPQCAPRAPCRS